MATGTGTQHPDRSGDTQAHRATNHHRNGLLCLPEGECQMGLLQDLQVQPHCSGDLSTTQGTPVWSSLLPNPPWPSLELQTVPH